MPLQLLRTLCSLLLTTLLVSGCASLPGGGSGAGPLLAHDVFFELQDPSLAPELVEDCYGMLGGIEGVMVLHAGERCETQAGPVNDTSYHVALRVLFEDEAALEAYIVDGDHTAFVEKHRASWASVRVFDSEIEPR